MRITEISEYKGETVCVMFERGSRIYINRRIAAEYNLKAGLELPRSAVEEIVHANEHRRAWERALYLLDSRDYSFKEIYEKLEKITPRTYA